MLPVPSVRRIGRSPSTSGEGAVGQSASGVAFVAVEVLELVRPHLATDAEGDAASSPSWQPRPAPRQSPFLPSAERLQPRVPPAARADTVIEDLSEDEGATILAAQGAYRPSRVRPPISMTCGLVYRLLRPAPRT